MLHTGDWPLLPLQQNGKQLNVKNITFYIISLDPSLAPYHLWWCSRDQRKRGFEEEGGRRKRKEKEEGKKEEQTRKEKRRNKNERNKGPT